MLPGVVAGGEEGAECRVVGVEEGERGECLAGGAEVAEVALDEGEIERGGGLTGIAGYGAFEKLEGCNRWIGSGWGGLGRAGLG